MSNITALIEQNISRRYPHLLVKCVPEFDPYTFSSHISVVVNGIKTKWQFVPSLLEEIARQHGHTEEQVAEQWASTVVGLDQIVHANGGL